MTGIVEKYCPGPGRQQVFRERRLVSTAEQMKAGLRLPAFVWISSQRQTRCVRHERVRKAEFFIEKIFRKKAPRAVQCVSFIPDGRTKFARAAWNNRLGQWTAIEA